MPNLLLVQNLNPGNSDSLWKEGLNKILTTENLWRQSHHPIWSTLLSSSDSWGLIILSGVSKWKQSYQHQGHCSLPLNRRQQKMCQCQRAMRVQKGNRCTNDSSSSVGPVMMKWKGGKKKKKKTRHSFQCAYVAPVQDWRGEWCSQYQWDFAILYLILLTAQLRGTEEEGFYLFI